MKEGYIYYIKHNDDDDVDDDVDDARTRKPQMS